MVTGATFKWDELKIDMLRYLENISKAKTSKNTFVENNIGNNRNINQRPNTNNQKKDVMARRKFKQMAANFAKL